MSGLRDTDACTLAWCDERSGHDGPHRAYLLSGHGLDVDTGKAATIVLTLQGESARTFGLVVTTDATATGLPWALASSLAGAISTAARRHAN
jgi:hypothetical protein